MSFQDWDEWAKAFFPGSPKPRLLSRVRGKLKSFATSLTRYRGKYQELVYL